MKNAMKLVQVYKNLDEIIHSSIKDNSVKPALCSKLIDLRTDVHDSLLDSVGNLTSNQQNDIFDKLEEISNNRHE